MKHILSSILILIISLICVSTHSCKTDDELERLKKPDWSPELVLPLVHAKINIENILSSTNPGSHLYVDEDQKITLVYEDVIASKNAEDVLEVLRPVVTLLPSQSEYPINLIDNAVLAELTAKAGQLDLQIDFSGRSTAKSGQITFLNLEQDGAPVQLNFEDGVPAQSTLDLAGSRFNFNPPYDYNTLVIIYDFLDELGNEIKGFSSVFISFRNVAFDRAKGWFDQISLDISKDTLTLDIFNVWQSGTLYIENPQARLNFRNSLGVPMSASLSLFEAGNFTDGSTIVPIDFKNALGDSFALAFPNSSEVEGFVNSSYMLDKNNSNLQNVIAISPRQIHYDLDLISNHSVNRDEIGFVDDTSKVEMLLAVDLPLTLRIDDAFLTDTFQVEADLGDDLQNLERAFLEINTTNGLPLAISMQLFFLDRNGAVLDSALTSREYIVDGQVDENGFIQSPGEWSTGVELNSDKVEVLQKTKSIALIGTIETLVGGDKTVSFYTHNYFGLDLALQLKYRIN